MKSGFYREVKIGDSKVTIELEHLPISQEKDTLIFGFPLIDQNPSSLSTSSRGYFLSIELKGDKVILTNDICGGYRLYYCRIGSDYHLSDNYKSLLNKLNEQGLPAINQYEKNFWKRQRYCTGSSTWFEELKKMAPASQLTFSSNGFSEEFLFPDLPNSADRKKHSAASLAELQESLKIIAADTGRRLLFFSGGADSTLLALLLKELQIDFTAIFLKANPFYRANYGDLQRAEKVAVDIGIKLVTLEVDLTAGLADLDRVIDRMLFDRHFALLHFEGLKNIAERFGSDSIIISGQVADSILSFGPSASTKGDLAARVLARYPDSLPAKLAAAMVRKKHGRHLRLPNGKNETLAAFFDPHDYYSLIDSNQSVSYKDYVDQVVSSISDKFEHRLACLLYLKNYGFIQGSDNQVVIQSAKAAGLQKIFMPFATYGFIEATMRYQSRFFETISPKYIIADLLKQIGYQHSKFTPDYSGVDFSKGVRVLQEVEQNFFEAEAATSNFVKAALADK